MTTYFVCSARGEYHEVRAFTLEAVQQFSELRFGKGKMITDVRKSPYLAKRKFAGLSELPYGYEVSA